MRDNRNKAQSIVGFSRNRAEADFYPTPPEATEALFIREKFDGLVWEPASGDGSMSKIIEKYNKCQSSDIQKEEWIYGKGGIDFLKCNCCPKSNLNSINFPNNIITNPPYRYGKQFVLHAKKIAKKKIAMLLKLVFLEGANRYRMFQDTEFPLKIVYVFCKRVKIYKQGLIGKNSGLIAYAWFVWDKDYKGKPYIEWIL